MKNNYSIEEGEYLEPLVSIIMPTYKGSNLISRSIESLIEQNYKNIEIIIVDDNGKDSVDQKKTEKVVEKYFKDERIKYICHEKNINGSAARNTGIKLSNGDFICFLDDDDVFDKQKVQKQVNFFKSNLDVGLVYTGLKEINGNNERIVSPLETDNFLRDYLMGKIFVCSSSIMIRKSILSRVGPWDESFKRHQDMEFIARIADLFKVSFINEPLVIKYAEERNLPKDSEKTNLYRRHYLKKMMPIINKFDKKTSKNIVFFNLLPIAKVYLKNKEFLKALFIALESKKPLKMMYYFIKDGIKYKRRKK